MRYRNKDGYELDEIDIAAWIVEVPEAADRVACLLGYEILEGAHDTKDGNSSENPNSWHQRMIRKFIGSKE